MYELKGVLNDWPANRVGGVPVKPSYGDGDPVACLIRLTWSDRSLWVPGHANRWNREFVLGTVQPDETDRRSESLVWVHRTDITRVLPAEPSQMLSPVTRDQLEQERARSEARAAAWARENGLRP